MDAVTDEITRLAAQRPPVSRDWSELPTDALYQVMCHLPCLHGRLSLAAVCRHWHAGVRQILHYALPKLCLTLPRPSDMFFTFQPGSGSSILKTHRNHPTSRRYHGYYRGATSGQLLFANDDGSGAYSLVDPFTGRERLLPAIPSGIRVHVRKMVVCPDGLVAAILGDERSAKVALCAPERAWSWSLAGGSRWYADMVFFHGKLYALTNCEDLLALDVGYDDLSGEPKISAVQCVIDGRGGGRYTLQEYTRIRYLVVRPRGGGLLMVSRVMLKHSLTTCRFWLFQADIPSSRWVEVDTLGDDEALFISRLCSKAVRAERHETRGDQIFFLDDSARMEGPALGDALASVYDMKDGRVNELLPKQQHRYAEAPATWLFREDADAEE